MKKSNLALRAVSAVLTAALFCTCNVENPYFQALMERNDTSTQTADEPAHTVSFDANGGFWDDSIDILTKTDIKGTVGSSMPSNPARIGYTLICWNTLKIGSSGTVFVKSTPVNSDITVYAQWRHVSDAVIGSADGGGESVLNLSQYIDKPLYGAAPDTVGGTNDYYTISSITWYKNSDGSTWNTTFEADTEYKAVVVLTAKTYYTFSGVSANCFSHNDTQTVTNSANSGTVTIEFPATSALPTVATPIADPPAGAVSSDTTITLNSTTIGAAIYYTTNNSIPSASSTRYTAAIGPLAAGETTIKAIAIKTGMANSTVMTAKYTVLTTIGGPSALNLTQYINKPVYGATPITVGGTNAYYTISSITWSRYSDGTPIGSAMFAPETVYKAEVVLTAKAGYTFNGVGANAFSHSDATSATNSANTGTVTIIFPATAAPPEQNIVSTLPGLGEYYTVSGVSVDSVGKVYDTYGNSIVKTNGSTGVVALLAGSSGTSGYLEGTGAAARFSTPGGVAVDSAGNVYVADSGNNRIRKISPSGVVTTFAGSGTAGYADGAGTAAKFSAPVGVAVDSTGIVYVADNGNHRIRKISPAGAVTTLAGNGTAGYADGTGTAAKFNSPYGVAVDGAGYVYVGDSDNSRIRKISPAGAVTTFAGSGTEGYADGTGTASQFYNPRGVAVDSAGYVYVADEDNNRIRKISPAGVVTTLAGSGSSGFVDGIGTAARFSYPVGVAVDSAGYVYVADWGNNTVRKLTAP
jgi:sugar lactone lactonase YvrE